MSVNQIKRSDLKKLITISILIRRLSDAFSMLSEETKGYFNSHPYNSSNVIDSLGDNVDDAISELKKPDIDNYNYKKYKRTKEFQSKRVENDNNPKYKQNENGKDIQ